MVEHEELIRVDIDFDDWLARGSGGSAAAPLVARLLDEQPPGAESFRVVEGEDGRRLHQHYWLVRWRRPS